MRDILIACVDGLTGSPDAIEAIFPKTTVQTCIVHLIRASLRYVPRREREQVARDLKPMRTPPRTPTRPKPKLETFDEKWGSGSRVITQTWLNAWENVTPFLAFPDEVRRVIYTTNAIEDSTANCARRSRPRAASPTRTPPKLVYLALQNAVPDGHGPGIGRQCCSRLTSTSATASPILQTDHH